jgi:oligosaccharide reducing-end xylanase
MIIAVMMNRQDLFDKLWKFAKQNMQFTSGEARGYFSWQLTGANFTTKAGGPAPDGEEYYVTSLYLADKRWGSSPGVANYLNYKQQADSILTYMLPGRSGQGPMFDTVRAQVLFIPNVTYTDPSYHLPAFYRMWGAFASHHNALWNRMADTSIAFMSRSWNSTTGLNPKFTTFDGAPMPSGTNNDAAANLYSTDAVRTPMNYAMEWSWFKSNPVIVTNTKKLLSFLYSKGVSAYSQEYALDGTSKSQYTVSEAQVGANGAAVLASDNDRDYAFVDALWNKPLATGQWRYYNGLVQMLGILHASGTFKAYGSPGMTGIPTSSSRSTAADFRVDLKGRNLSIRGLGEASVGVFDARGRGLAGSSGEQSVDFALPHAGVWVIDAGAAGHRTIAVH